MVADNSPFTSLEIKQVSNKWNFNVTNTSPYFSQSNGLLEKEVGNVKQNFKKMPRDKITFWIVLVELYKITCFQIRVFTFTTVEQ